MTTTRPRKNRAAKGLVEPDEAKPSTPEIGRRIYAVRKARHLTLCDVEKKSGLSISVLSQIERGKVNPTINTLWQLTQSLNIELSDLIERSSETTSRSQIIEVIRQPATPTATSANGQCTIRVHTPQRQVLPVEWYEMTLLAGAKLISEPRPDRAWQHVTVLSGVVEIQLADGVQTIKAGDTARFSTKLSHSLRCLDNSQCVLAVVVISPFELIGTGYSHYGLE